MWIYSQSTGNLWDRRGVLVGSGYSGFNEGKNNPRLEAMSDIGPIPRGKWVISRVYNSKNTGPYTLELLPSGHNALMRTNFRIHGQTKENWGSASRGCIVLPPSIRTQIWESGDKILTVIE